jgi:hypothetical protein
MSLLGTKRAGGGGGAVSVQVAQYVDRVTVCTAEFHAGAARRSLQPLSCIRNCKPFTEPENSLPRSQDLSTGLRAEPSEFGQDLIIHALRRNNIIHPSTSRFLKLSLSLYISHNHVCVLISVPVSHVPRAPFKSSPYVKTTFSGRPHSVILPIPLLLPPSKSRLLTRQHVAFVKTGTRRHHFALKFSPPPPSVIYLCIYLQYLSC